MKNNSLNFKLSLVLLALAFTSMVAQAQATRTWVSGVGDDVNPCSRTAPCKTFAGAISKTAAGGEISVLDPGGYGAVTVTKSITINGDGTLAGILNASTNGVVINDSATATPGTIKVTLRNLSINGAGSGLDGIRFISGNQLVVDNVTISGNTGDGIDVALTNTTGGRVFVKDTRITNCTGDGIRLGTSAVGSVVTATLDNVRIEGVADAVEAVTTNVFVQISRSTLANNANGVLMSVASSFANVENSTLSFNGNGVNANAASTIRISENAIYNNTQGVRFVGGGIVASDGTNRINGNGSSQAPNGVLTKQ